MLEKDLESDTFEESDHNKIKSPENNSHDKELKSETSNEHRPEVQNVPKSSDCKEIRSK